MNFDKYTQNAQQAVADCQSIAIANGQQQLEGEHLHLALLRQREGLAPPAGLHGPGRGDPGRRG